MEDKQILDLFFDRSQRAVEETEKKYGERLGRLALNLLNNTLDAEECVSDTLLAAWNAIPPARPLPLLPWLYKTARNLCLKRYRHDTAQKRGGDGFDAAYEELENTLSAGEGPEEALDAKELGKAVNGFVKRLSPGDRQLFLGRYWYGQTCAELAEEEGITANACAVRLSRLRERLRKHLEKEGVL